MDKATIVPFFDPTVVPILFFWGEEIHRWSFHILWIIEVTWD